MTYDTRRWPELGFGTRPYIHSNSSERIYSGGSRGYGFAGLEQESLSLFGRMITPPLGDAVGAVNTLISSLKSAGIWDKLSTLKFFSTNISATQADLLLDWKSASYNGTAVNSPTFSSIGVTGNASSSYINSGFNPSLSSKYTQNDHSHIVYVSASPGASAAVEAGDTNSYIVTRNTGDVVTVRSASTSGANTTSTVATALGMTSEVRTASGNTNIYKDGSLLQTITLASNGLSNTNMYICARNGAGTPVSFSARTVFMHAAGASLTAMDVANLSAAVEAFKTAIGA